MGDFPATGFSQGFSSGARLRQARNANDLAERRFQSDKDLQNRKFQLDKARGGRAQQELNSKIGNKLLDTLKQQVEQVVAAEGVDPQARLKTLEGMKKIFGEVYQPSLAANGINVDLGGLIDTAASRVAKASDAATIARNTAAAQSQPEVLGANAATARSKLGPQEVGAPTPGDPTQVQKAFISPITGKAEPIPGTEKSRITVQAPDLAGAQLTKPNVTAAQQAVSKATTGVQGLAAIDKQINEGSVGALGALSGLLNVTAAQADPSFFNANRNRFETTVKSVRERMLKTMSDDNRFNKDDRAAVENLFPSTGVLESVPNARGKVNGLYANLIRTLGQGLTELDASPTGILSGIDIPRIKLLVDENRLSREEAANALIRLGIIK